MIRCKFAINVPMLRSKLALAVEAKEKYSIESQEKNNSVVAAKVEDSSMTVKSAKAIPLCPSKSHRQST